MGTEKLFLAGWGGPSAMSASPRHSLARWKREEELCTAAQQFPLRRTTARKDWRGFGSKYHVFIQQHKNAKSNLLICMLTLEGSV